jgi:four helix bundle protein
MARISRFEELLVWQKAKSLAVDLYRVTRSGPISRDFALRDQMRSAAISVMSNIAEGFERFSRAEFRHFLSISRGSAAELRSQLYLAYELEYLTEHDIDHLRSVSVEVTRMLTSLWGSIEP